MIRLVLDTQTVAIRGAGMSTLKMLGEATSYKVAGYYHHPAFRARKWDGRTHLLTYDAASKSYSAPIGLLGDIRAALDEAGKPYEVKRRPSPPRDRVMYEWNDEIQLRDYQLDAVNAFCQHGRGILKMPIRSGKTKTSARIIWRKQARTLVMVPSQLLLHQTAASYRECFPKSHIGIIGDGEWDRGDITVATVQTLVQARGNAKRTCKGNVVRDLDTGMVIKDRYTLDGCACGKAKCLGGRVHRTDPDPRYAELMENHDFVVFDECHHLKGEAWREVMMDSPARLRLGLSATAYLKNAREIETGVLWLKACCGDVVYEVETSLLIERGYLMRQEVEFHKCSRPIGLEDSEWSQDLQKRGIQQNVHRNKLIVAIARRHVAEGHLVLIATNRVAQVAAIERILLRNRVSHHVVIGRTSGEQRNMKLAEFRRGDVPVLVGTVFAEGVDIPEVSVVINAEGGRDAKATVQRMRNMTPHEGKARSIMIDFWDDTNPHFRKHSRARYKTYTSEKAFIVRKMWGK